MLLTTKAPVAGVGEILGTSLIPHGSAMSDTRCMSTRGRSGFSGIATSLSFVFLSALIAVTASERVYWYWGFAGADPADVALGTLEVALLYSVPMAVALWAMARTPVRRLHQLVLASAIFAFVVEGVLTAEIFQAGPIDPIFPAMFVGWHGLLAMVGFWYLTRRWLIERRRRLLGTASVAMGVLWGLWATTSWLPGNLADAAPNETRIVADPTTFALYAAWVGAVFIAGHWLLGRVWRPQFNPGRVSTVALAAVMIGLHALVFIAVPWAPFKLAALLGFVAWALIRSRRGCEGPTILEQLDGRIRWREAVLLALMPATAAATYAAAWAAAVPDGVIEVVFAALVAVQVLAGAAAFVWASIKAFRAKEPDRRASS